MTETIPKDPEGLTEFYSIMGPYINLVPEEVRAKHGMVNGNGTKFLNNNTEGKTFDMLSSNCMVNYVL